MTPLPLPRRQYPVIVTDTREHVLWVEADSPEQALTRARRDTWDRINYPDDVASQSITASLPDKWDWRMVTEDSHMGYEGTRFDEHVKEHERLLRQQEHDAKQAACAEAGHVGNEHTWANGWIECRLCYVTLVEAPTIARGASVSDQASASPIARAEAASGVSDRG